MDDQRCVLDALKADHTGLQAEAAQVRTEPIPCNFWLSRFMNFKSPTCTLQVREDLRQSRSEAAVARDQVVVQVRRVAELEAALHDRDRDLAAAAVAAAAAAAERERASGAEKALLAGMEAEREKAKDEISRLVDETRGILPWCYRARMC